MTWYDITEEYPDDNDVVLVCDILNKFISVAKFVKENENVYHFLVAHLENPDENIRITHWMCLPSLPMEV